MVVEEARAGPDGDGVGRDVRDYGSFAAQFEGAGGDHACAERGGHRGDGVDLDELSGGERRGEGGRTLRLAGENRDAAPAVARHSGRDAAEEAAAAHREDDEVRFRPLLRDLVDHGRMTVPHDGVVEGVDVLRPFILRGHGEGEFVRLLPAFAGDDHLGAE